MFLKKPYLRMVNVIVILSVLLALPLGSAYASNENGDKHFTSADEAPKGDSAALLCLALVGGVAILAASVLLVEFRKLL
ncbi:MAG TPA: hypothetical protein ENN19_04280 [Chloroflexi bacterium]|nr:hypothetical protein [Chloroflexota bacterium]